MPGLYNGVVARAVPMRLCIGPTHCAVWLTCVQPPV